MGFAARKMPRLREWGVQVQNDEKRQIGVRQCVTTQENMLWKLSI